ncbi:hypothetical protein DFJ73DRAFT_819609, partial [Zopfochytrium polystomum]
MSLVAAANSSASSSVDTVTIDRRGVTSFSVAAPTGPSYMLNYYGGPLMTAPVNLYVIWYGNQWDSSLSQQLAFHTFLDNLSYGSWWQIMKQYKITQKMRFAGAVTAPKTGTTIDEAEIGPLIGGFVSRKVLPADPDALYIFVAGKDTLPKQMTTQQQAYCQVFCGYHSDFSDASTGYVNLKFTVQGLTCPYCGDANPWIALQMTSSHEISEAVTDPYVNQATVVGPPVAWYNEKYGEVADICNSMQGTSTNASGYTLIVQKIWSNAALACV